MNDDEELRAAAESAGISPENYLSLVQGLDSIMAVMPQMMRALFGIYTEAIEAGFTEEQAFALVVVRATNWLGG